MQMRQQQQHQPSAAQGAGQRRRSIFDLGPPPQHRPIKNFVGASPAVTSRLNLARKEHSEMVDKVVAEEKRLSALQESLGRLNRELSDLDNLKHTREAMRAVKVAVDRGLMQIQNNV